MLKNTLYRQIYLLNGVIKLILRLQFSSGTVCLHPIIKIADKKDLYQFCLLTYSCLKLSLSHKHQQSDRGVCTKYSNDSNEMLTRVFSLQVWQGLSDFFKLSGRFEKSNFV